MIGQRREVRVPEAAEQDPASDRPAEPQSITASIAAAAERQAERHAEQRLGFTARRAAILAAVVCVLTLTIAGPVRTFFAQRTEMQQLAASEATLRAQIAGLEEGKAKLADPVFIAAQARERLGFVMPGDIPYQVQLPPGADVGPPAAGGPAAEAAPDLPWYSSLWKTIADAPQTVPDTTAPPAPPAPPPGG